MLYSIIGILVIILDQLVKLWVDSNIHEGNVIELIPKVLSLVRVQNDGAAFSFLSGGSARIWFIALTAVFALLVVLALATNFVSGRFGRWCLVLITAGGLSNMIDRIRFGYVIDMFKIELFDFAVFNVADIFIAVFSIAFILYILFGGEKLRDPDADEFDEDEDYEEEVRPRRGRAAVRDRYEEEEEAVSQPRPRKRTAPVKEEASTEEQRSVRKPRSSAAAPAASKEAVREEPARQARPRTRAAAPSAEKPASAQPPRQRTRAPESFGDKPTSEQIIRQRARAASQATERSAAEARKAAGNRSSDAMFEEMFAHKEGAAPAAKPKSSVQPPVRRGSSAPRSSVPASKGEDPFAEWENANKRVREDSKAAYQKATAAAARSSKAASDSSQDAFSDFLAASSAPAPEKKPAPKAPQTQVRKSPPSQQQAAPKKKPAPAPSAPEEDFDLDSILNEFR